MPMADYGTYKTRSLLPRQDADGKVFRYARALGGATVKSPYILYITAGTTTMGGSATGAGYVATAPFATGVAASVSAFLGIGTYWYSISEQTLASGNDGWFQTGGPCISATLATCSATTGVYYTWVAASVTSLALSLTAYQTNQFAVALTSNTGGLPAGGSTATYTCHDIYLLDRPVFGIG